MCGFSLVRHVQILASRILPLASVYHTAECLHVGLTLHPSGLQWSYSDSLRAVSDNYSAPALTPDKPVSPAQYFCV